MRLYCVSLNHHCTSMELRERVAFAREEAIDFLQRLCAPTESEGVILSTCNRTEIYSTGSPGQESTPWQPALELLHADRGFEPVLSPPNHWRDEGAAVVRHLLRVSAGLESQVLGETEILGQVRTALSWADEAGTCGRRMRRLWERAIGVGKRVRAETLLGDGALSHAAAAFELARKVFGPLERHRILVVGTRERAEEMAAAHREGGGGPVEVRPFEQLEASVIDADVVLTSTAAGEPILDHGMMRRIRAERGGRRSLLLLDLALPRAVDPRAGEIDGVYLKNLDDLAAVIRSNEAQRRDEVPKAEALVQRGTDAYLDWLRGLSVEPTVRDLRDRFERVRREELEELRPGLDAEAFARLDAATRRLIARLLHAPSANLRRDDSLHDPRLLGMLQRLFEEERARESDEDPAHR
jgi:glutamyl-tRNA reductase